MTFKVAPAEQSVVADGSVDLITVAQAIHWFDNDIFYPLVRKALAPGGLIAAWGYSFFRITPELDRILDPYGRKFLAESWSARNWLLINEYKELPFPFTRIATPTFELALEWNFEELLGYLESWSATQKYKEAHQKNPVDTILPALQKAWGPPQSKRRIEWDLYLLVGKISA